MGVGIVGLSYLRAGTTYLLPTMYNRLVRTQTRKSQCPDFCAHSHFLSLVAFIWDLYVVCQCQSLHDKMIIHQVEHSSRQKVRRHIQIASIACPELQRIDREAMGWNMSIRGREDRRLGRREWWRRGVVVRVVCARLSTDGCWTARGSSERPA